ncbi:MAG: hypothetical protein ACRENB_06140 [Gemmatimonadales bacterium]
MPRAHRWNPLTYLAVLAGMTAASAACQDRERVDITAEPVAEFSKRVDEYVALRNSLADSIGHIDETKSQEEIAARATGLAAAILSARPAAKQGDIFTPEVASVLATLIREEYRRRPPAVQETRGDTQEELPDFVPEVNQIYPTTYPLATFPASLLPLLPKLPEQVEYRMVGRYLILRDIEANLIVDVMPNALPASVPT